MNKVEGLVVGCIIGILSIGILMAATDGFIKGKAIAECELNLPRTEKCVLIAVPEKEAGK